MYSRTFLDIFFKDKGTSEIYIKDLYMHISTFHLHTNVMIRSIYHMYRRNIIIY